MVVVAAAATAAAAAAAASVDVVVVALVLLHHQMMYVTDMVCNSAPRRGNWSGATCPTMVDYSFYFETDVLGTVQYPQGVKMITANFAVLFGTGAGQALKVSE